MIIIEKTGGGICFQTEDMKEICGYELEITASIEPDTAEEILERLSLKIKNGIAAEDGLMVEGVGKYPVFIVKTKSFYEDKTDAYRVIIADANGFYPWDIKNGERCEDGFSEQILFENDKGFYVYIYDLKRIEEIKKCKIPDPFIKCFEKYKACYIAPFQFCIGGNKEGLVRQPPFVDIEIADFVRKLRFWHEINKIKVLCVDVDRRLKINKPFLEYRERW